MKKFTLILPKIYINQIHCKSAPIQQKQTQNIVFLIIIKKFFLTFFWFFLFQFCEFEAEMFERKFNNVIDSFLIYYLKFICFRCCFSMCNINSCQSCSNSKLFCKRFVFSQVQIYAFFVAQIYHHFPIPQQTISSETCDFLLKNVH